MNTVLQQPLGVWKLSMKEGLMPNFSQRVEVWKDGRNLRAFKVCVPTEIIRHVRKYWKVDQEDVRFSLQLEGARAYLMLHIDREPPVEQALFYWIKSKAPVWLRSYMGRV